MIAPVTRPQNAMNQVVLDSGIDSIKRSKNQHDWRRSDLRTVIRFQTRKRFLLDCTHEILGRDFGFVQCDREPVRTRLPVAKKYESIGILFVHGSQHQSVMPVSFPEGVQLMVTKNGSD